jgi:hypothetical protein
VLAEVFLEPLQEAPETVGQACGLEVEIEPGADGLFHPRAGGGLNLAEGAQFFQDHLQEQGRVGQGGGLAGVGGLLR